MSQNRKQPSSVGDALRILGEAFEQQEAALAQHAADRDAVHTLGAGMEKMAEAFAALASREQPVPQVTVQNIVEPTSVEVRAIMPAPTVTVVPEKRGKRTVTIKTPRGDVSGEISEDVA